MPTMDELPGVGGGAPGVVEREFRLHRGWLTALGVVFVGLGLACISAAFAATLATVLLFAVLLLLAGAAQLARALASQDDDFGWDLASGLVYLVAGALLVADPVSGAVGLTLLLAAFFLFLGIVRLALARRAKRIHGTSGALTATGVLDLVLGALIVLGWPETSTWLIGLFLGIELVFAGVSLVLLGYTIGRSSRRA